MIADSPKGKNADEIVVVGAHLDSVLEGPGINDNGSGSATILEIAEQLAELGYTKKLQRQVRFAFWGAEETNLLGSEHYVDNLTDAQQAKIYANLNFDMLGSPNYVRFVYDGDGSDPSRPVRRGPTRSRQIFTDYFTEPGPGQRADGVQRPLRLRPVHRRRHSGRRAVQRRRGHQDRRRGSDLRWHGRCTVRRLLPPGLRHHQQPEHQRVVRAG